MICCLIYILSATFEDGAFVTYNFTGDAVSLYGAIGPSAGPYLVSIDGKPALRYNASKPTYRTQIPLFEANNLGLGKHSVKLMNAPDSFGNSLSLDYAVVSK